MDLRNGVLSRFPPKANRIPKMNRITDKIFCVYPRLVPSCVQTMLGGVFAISGISKVINLMDFGRRLVEALPIFSDNVLTLLAIIIIGSELMIGICLFTQRFVSTALLSSACLLSIFSIFSIFEFIVPTKGGCGCFGIIAIDDLSPGVLIIRNLLLLGLGWFGYFSHSRLCKN